jgi:hypothetical protein
MSNWYEKAGDVEKTPLPNVWRLLEPFGGMFCGRGWVLSI